MQTGEGPLRQGDVVRLEYFPLWEPKHTSLARAVTGELTGLLSLPWPGPLAVDGQALAVLCSHDCDVENPRERTGLILAPIVKVPASPDSERFYDIMRSGAAVDEEWDFIQLFPLNLPQKLGHPSSVVDFSALCSMGRAHVVVEQLLDARCAQMSQEEAENFRLKLAAFIARPNQDPRDDNHDDSSVSDVTEAPKPSTGKTDPPDAPAQRESRWRWWLRWLTRSLGGSPGLREVFAR